MKVHAFAASTAATRLMEFDFKEYIFQKADAVHRALDAAVPLNHPEHIHEAMRYYLLRWQMHPPHLYLTTCKLIGGHDH